MRPLTAENLEAKLRTAIADGDTARILTLGAQLDNLDQNRPRPQLLASALWYASVGLHVFPLRPGQKIPFPGTHGCKDATTDEATVRAWWAEHPDANVGIATGHLVDVIDIDGPTGVRSWAASKNLPTVLGRVDTPRPGGTHLYVAATGNGNKAGMFPGIDYRGTGGYVVAPPSVNADGLAYTWTTPLAGVSKLEVA